MIKLLLSLILLTSCARSPIKAPHQALRISKQKISYVDDGDLESIQLSLSKSIRILTEQKTKILNFGPLKIPALSYANELKLLLNARTKAEFIQILEENFESMEVYGGADYSEILLTSYFEPILKGSKSKTKKYSQALFSSPKDLVTVDLKAFSHEQIGNFITKRDKIFGRLHKTKGNKLLISPHFSRKEIDIDKKLSKDQKVFAYVDPIDAFFLHIQGSGTVEFSNNQSLRLGYASQNGHIYYPIGKDLLDIIPREEMSLQKIAEHLRTLNKDELHLFLSRNPSYIFFRELDGEPETASGATVTEKRTLAIDPEMFPLGALAFLKYKEPLLEGSMTPPQFKDKSLFVMAQDTGGAIKGPARADFFAGKGEKAKALAGSMAHKANLYFLVPKKYTTTIQ